MRRTAGPREEQAHITAAPRLVALERLLAAATDEEQRFLRALVLGETGQGELEGLATQAVAEVFAPLQPQSCTSGPEFVLEVAFDGVRSSHRCPGGWP